MENRRYIWQQQDWPHFYWQPQAGTDNVYAYIAQANRLLGEVGQLVSLERQEMTVDLLVSEAIKTSQIEGENLDREDVRSSIRNQLGLNIPQEKVVSAASDGIGKMLASVRTNFTQNLTSQQLWQWQSLVIGNSLDGALQQPGRWRSGPDPMQIVSRAYGRERVHYEAPPAESLPEEMHCFIAWFNGSRSKLRGAVRASVAHLYFECIHPFSDGNGRVGRAICEIALAQELGHPVLMSLSSVIEKRRKDYYNALAQASCGGLDITSWIDFFTGVIREAQQQAASIVGHTLAKARFWNCYREILNERQHKVVSRMFRAGPEGFIGGMSTGKYMKIADCSKATATRDLTRLLEIGAFYRLEGKGRNTRYSIKENNASNVGTFGY